MNQLPLDYIKNIKSRSFLRFLLGLVNRRIIFIKFSLIRLLLRIRGVGLGRGSIVFSHASKHLSSNFHMKSGVISDTSTIDCRAPVFIGDHVIIGSGAKIITCSHDIDSEEWTLKRYGIEIEDYVWIASNALILPSCRKIGRGAVIGAGSVVAKNVDAMAIMVGNPATRLCSRKKIHSKLFIPAMFGADFKEYFKAYFCKLQK